MRYMRKRAGWPLGNGVGIGNVPTLLCAALALAGCDDLISVEAPSRVAADELDDPGNAALLVVSVAADFECAFGDYVIAGGLTGNELEVGTTLIVTKEYDKRDFNPSSSLYNTGTCANVGTVGVYKPLSTARWQGENTLALLAGWSDADVPDRSGKMATVGIYSGFAQVMIGEAMCSAAFDLGPELTPAQIFERAAGTFATALGSAGGNAELQALANVGRARALGRLGQLSEAATAAAAVPEGFVFNATFSNTPDRRRNAIWEGQVFIPYATVDPSYRNLSWDGVPDPRVDLIDTGGPAIDAETPLWVARQYDAADVPIPLATWEEAQLILAQAALAAGNLPGAVTIINDLHTRVGLPPTFASSDANEVMAQLVQERQRQLFLQSHHFGDIKQFNIPLTPEPGVPFKDGGGVYRDQVCFPIPDIETTNNPNIG